MATVNFIPCSKQCTSSMKNEIAYILQDFKVGIEPEKLDCNHTMNYQSYSETADKSSCIKLISGKDCCPETAYHEFMATKSSYKKADKTMFYHYDQAFKDGENISPKTAHEIAIKFAEDNYPDFEVVIATHVDNEHLHSHFIINSVSFRTGKKLHDGPKTLLKLRAYSDQICQQYGLSTLEPYTGGKSYSLSSREYRAAVKGQSWKFSLMNAIDFSMKSSGNKEDFIKNMERQGYSVKWTQSRKSITYTCPNTMTCRDFRLHDDCYLKEMMEREFELRRIEIEERRLTQNRTATPDHRTLHPDTGETQQPILQPESHLGNGIGTAETVATHRSAVGQATNQTPAGGDEQEFAANTADHTTGWEKEREAFFMAEVSPTAPYMDSRDDLSAVELSDVASDLVRLGKSVEQFESPVSVAPPTTSIMDKKAYKKLMEKKIASGHKEDDTGKHDFDMTMTM